ncbi:S-adenosyl-dependent methyltransferase activity on membrane-located substrates [Desulfosarcina cetonica]|uniref:16S rRNA (cytosine(1402)-N(4))-methyltransferase RsmH n=1 Tax=Desulfosarcina cetonica TaxID=90730 RepID=UPI0006D007E5|nr:16S rRNA (cytosine(1402)-N(4))-methyltransferase RsmH [Desulfosarcina cetonica]VTR66396.1 S-adenosyl-dependent methyltransferase activity on membrane-located substrates [Desulfosarcina cetonica]
MSDYHITAMLAEAVDMLACRPGSTIVDGTLGGCGHAREICRRIVPGGTLVGIDQDRDAIERAHRILPVDNLTIHIVHANFVDLPLLLSQLNITAVDGILVDIGLSQHQLEASGRGFSFNRDEPLDMRMDVRSAVTAADLVATLSERELAGLFSRYGEERWAGRIARQVVARRRHQPVTTSGQLARLVVEAVPAGAARKQRIHPATRVFMALRIAVNRELEVLDRFLEAAVALLRPGGRLCVLAFHSLEDRMVKQRFRTMANPCTCPPALPRCVCGRRPTVNLLTRKVLRPTEDEVRRNPMARSTRLRAVEKRG